MFDTRTPLPTADSARSAGGGDVMLIRRLIRPLLGKRVPSHDTRRVLERAMALIRDGRIADVKSLLRDALASAPRDAQLRQLHASIVLGEGRAADALAEIDAIEAPRRAEAEFMRADALVRLGRIDDALAVYRDMRSSHPDFAAGFGAHGTLLSHLGRWDEAVEALREARRLDASSVAILNNLGNALKEIGEIREALACFDATLAFDPGFADALESRFFCLHYLPEATPQAIFDVAREFNDRYAVPLAAEQREHVNMRDPDRPLHIGYVSADFKRHPVGYFIDPVVEHHDHSQFSVTCYSSTGPGDDLTRRIEARTDTWRPVERLDDDALAEMIRADGIDILVDLSGHTRGNRLLALARRPAPVQATWLGFLDTTGLDAIDYIIVDPMFLPPAGSRQRLSESPLVLPRSYLCYRPPEYAPDVAPLPALGRGALRFGCFNNPAKLNERVIGLWASILKALPDAALVLRAHGLRHGRSREWLIGRFAAHGIGEARLDLRGGASHRELLATYAEIDIALDPFPYTGGLSTLEALWMGVPVITLAGDTLLGRMGVTCLGNAGLDGFVAASPEEYVDIARRCAGDLPRLAALRAGMRERLAASPLMDYPAFVRDLEAGFREVWRRWCDNGPGGKS